VTYINRVGYSLYYLGVRAYVDTGRAIPCLVRAELSSNSAVECAEAETGRGAEVPLLGVTIQTTATRVNAVLLDAKLVARHDSRVICQCRTVGRPALYLVGHNKRAEGGGQQETQHRTYDGQHNFGLRIQIFYEQ
jgi:hypothetical protein